MLLCSCRVSRELLAALPPSLTFLVIRQCQLVGGEDNFPKQLQRVFHEWDLAGLFSAEFRLGGATITEVGHQLAAT